MTDFAITDDLFFNRASLNQAQVEEFVDEALGNADDGELFLEYRQSESIVLDDGKIIEEGNHKTLIKNKNYYSELFKRQQYEKEL
mgnify:CR=1 FL=1